MFEFYFSFISFYILIIILVFLGYTQLDMEHNNQAVDGDHEKKSLLAVATICFLIGSVGWTEEATYCGFDLNQIAILHATCGLVGNCMVWNNIVGKGVVK